MDVTTSAPPLSLPTFQPALPRPAPPRPAGYIWRADITAPRLPPVVVSHSLYASGYYTAVKLKFPLSVDFCGCNPLAPLEDLRVLNPCSHN